MPDTPDDLSDPKSAIGLIFGEFLRLRQQGKLPSLDEYCQRYPDLAEQLRQHVVLYDALGEAGSVTDIRRSMENVCDPNAPDPETPKSAIDGVPSEERSERIGRYRIERTLGKGGTSQAIKLLEEMLKAGNTPEEVCRAHPELLTEVQQLWQRFRGIDAQVKELFPEVETFKGSGAAAFAPAAHRPTATDCRL